MVNHGVSKIGVTVSYLSKSAILSQPFFLTESYKGVPGKGVAIL